MAKIDPAESEVMDREEMAALCERIQRERRLAREARDRAAEHEAEANRLTDDVLKAAWERAETWPAQPLPVIGR